MGKAGRWSPGRYWPATAPRSWRACRSPEVDRPRQPARASTPTAASRASKVLIAFINSNSATASNTFHKHKDTKIHGQNETDENAVRQRKAHYGRGAEVIRSEKRNSAHRAECDSPWMAGNRKRTTRSPICLAISKPTKRERVSKADFAAKEEPEPQGQAATPGKLARRNTPCRNGRWCGRHARRRPPMAGPGRASQPASGCKQWPASFSRFEYHLVHRKKLNSFWLLLVNFWRLAWPERLCRPRGFS